MLADEIVRQGEKTKDVIVGDSVVHEASLAPCGDEPAPAEACQVAREATLERAGQVNQLAYGALALRQNLKHADSGRIAESAEELRRNPRGGRGGAQGSGLRGHLDRQYTLCRIVTPD